MKRIGKWVFRLLLLLVVLITLLILGRNIVARELAEHQLRAETGMVAVIGQVRIRLTSPVLRLEHVRLIHPPAFGGDTFLELPELEVAYDLGGLLERRLRLHRLQFHLAEFHLVRYPEGPTNLDLLRQHAQRRAAQRQRPDRLPHWDGIDTLRFSLGRLRYTDLQHPQRNQEIPVNVREATVQQVQSARDLEPVLARIALEKGVAWAADLLRTRRARPLPGAGPAAGNHATPPR